MKKTVTAYMAMLAFIFLSYLLFAIMFAILYHYAHLQPSFYSIATKICSYAVIILSGCGFALMIAEKKLLNGVIFCFIFALISTLLLWNHFQILPLLSKCALFLLAVILVQFIKK